MKAKILHNDSPFVRMTDLNFTISRDDFAWSFSATLDCDYWYLKTIMDSLGYIKLQTFGALSLFGTFTLNVEKISRSTKFNEFRMVTVSGRSRHVFGAAPLCPVKLFTIPSDLPVTDVIELARVHYNYTADLDGDFTTVGNPQILWYGEVFTVKKETMNMSGTFTDVITKLAELAGCAVVPDHRNRDMNIRPRYPELNPGWSIPLITPDDVESIDYESTNVKGANRVVVSGNIAPYEVTVTKSGAVDIISTEMQHDLVHDLTTGTLYGRALLDSQSVRDVLNVHIIRNKQRILEPAELIYVDDGVFKWLGVVTNSNISVKDNNGIPDYTATVSVEVYSKSASESTGRFTNPLVLQPPWLIVPGNYMPANSMYTVTAQDFDEAVGVSYSGGYAAPFLWVAHSSNVVVTKTSDYVFTLSKKAGQMTGMVVLGASDGYAPPTFWATTIDYSAVVVEPPTNMPPVALTDTATTAEVTPVGVNVLGNDYDPDGDVFRITSYTQGAHGVVSHASVGSMTLEAGGSVTTYLQPLTYAPEVGFVGEDTFSYTIMDAHGETDTAVVTVTVTATSGGGGIGLGTWPEPEEITAWGTGIAGTPVNATAMFLQPFMGNIDGFGQNTGIGVTTDGQSVVWLERDPVEGIVGMVYNIHTNVTTQFAAYPGMGYLNESAQPPEGFRRQSTFTATGKYVYLYNTYSSLLSTYVWEVRVADVTPTGFSGAVTISQDPDAAPPVTLEGNETPWSVCVSADYSTIAKWYPHLISPGVLEARVAIYKAGAEIGHTVVSSLISAVNFNVWIPQGFQLSTDGSKLLAAFKANSNGNVTLVSFDVNGSTGALTNPQELGLLLHRTGEVSDVNAFFVSPTRLVTLWQSFTGLTELGAPLEGDLIIAANVNSLSVPYSLPKPQPLFTADARVYLEEVSGAAGVRCDELMGAIKLGTYTYMLVYKRSFGCPILYRVQGL